MANLGVNLRFDYITFLMTLLIAGCGLLFVYSATTTETLLFSTFFKKQLLGIVSGAMIYLLCARINYQRLCYWGYSAYFVVILLLIFTKIKGSIGMGAQRWISLFLFKFQPSELTKLFLPPYIVYHLKLVSNFPAYRLENFVPLALGLMLSCILILKQPDLGTAVLIFLSGLIMLWLTGLRAKIIMSAGLILALSGPISWKFLRPYQKKRLEVFLGLGDRAKEAYQITQSKIAIGSGGLNGKGLNHGTQNLLNFLPESRTDFIFAVICEETGYLGALFLLLLYLLLFVRLLWFLQRLPQFFAKLLGVGLLVHIMISTLVNIGMVIGLLPTVGIPLPLVSYGVSNLWITFASLGWISGIIAQSPREQLYLPVESWD